MRSNDQNGNTGGPQFDEATAELYLLGELTEPEQEQFEIAYFDDDAFFERFLAVKNELLDLYARGELDPEKRARMEPHFLATGPRRKRVQESRNFINAVTIVSNRVTATPAPIVPAVRAPWHNSIARFLTPLRLAGATVFLLAALGGVWLLVSSESEDDRAGQSNYEKPGSNEDVALTPVTANVNGGPPNEVNQSGTNASPSEELAVNSRMSPIPQPKVVGPSEIPAPPTLVQSDPKVNDPNVVVPMLAPSPEVVAGNQTESITLDGSTRSVTTRNTANIGTSTRLIAIRLQFSGESYASYSVSLATIGGAAVWQARNVKGPSADGAKSLTVTVPANLLTRKDYIVILNGRTADGKSETIREYYFHVDRSGAN